MMEISTPQTLIIIYFLATMGFGFYKRSEKDVNSFLFAGRKLTIPALVATLVSTWYGGILEIGRFSYENGIITWIIFGFFYYVAALLYVKFIVPKIIESKISTIPELFLRSFGKWPAFIAIICVILMTSPAPYLKILANLFLHVWDIPIFAALCLGATLSLAYTFSGGFSAVVRTDKLQFVLMFMGFTLILSVCYFQYGGIEYLKSHTPDYAFQIPGNVNWTFVFVWGFIALITFIDPGFYQRTFAGTSLKAVKRGITISVIFWLIFDFMTVFTGIYALAILPPNSSSPYLDLSRQILPPVAQGLFMVSLFAIVMSTVDSFSFISAFTIGKNLSIWMNLKHGDKEILHYTRWGLVFTALFSILLAMVFEYAVDIWYMVGSFTVPALLIPLMAGLYQIKLKNPVLVILLPSLISITWYLHGLIHPTLDGFPGYIFGLEPMYPGVIVSLMLYLIKKTNYQC